MDLNNMTQSFRIREYYYMFVRHKKWFFSALVACSMGALMIAYTLPKIYRAQTVLMVEDEKILNPLISGLAVSPSVGARIGTLKAKLLSWERLTLLVEKLGMGKHIKTPLAQERLIQELRSNINVSMQRNNLIAISYEGEDPRKAQELVQTLADIITKGAITSVDLEANSAIRFIESQLEEYRTKLEVSEENLRQFQEIFNSVLPIATRMNEQLVQMRIDLSNLLSENTEAHPRVIQMKESIAQMEKQRDDFMKQAETKGFEVADHPYGELMSSVPLQQQQMAKLQRDYQVNNEIYQKLLQRLETAKISQTLEESDSGTKFKILEAARLPLSPVKPNKLLFFIGGLFAGSALGALIIFLIEASNNSIRNVEEARHLFELPIFGVIGRIEPEHIVLEETAKARAHV